MSAWERDGQTNEWYTPPRIFDALGEQFDLDVAAPPEGGPHVPADSWIHSDSLNSHWEGFIWCNPPFGGRNGLIPWLDKFLFHGYGICLTPDRTSAEWWQYVNRCSDATLFIKGKVKFLRPDGSEGKSPGTGTTLFACGLRAVDALRRAETRGLGTVMYRRQGRD